MLTRGEARDAARARSPRALAPSRTIPWFVAAALAWACADLLQVRAAVGDQPFAALAALVLSSYAALGFLAGTIFVTAAPVLPTVLRRPSAVLALAWVAFGAAFLAGYLNIVHLPAIDDPLTLAANAVLLAGAGAAWLLLSRARVLDAVASSGAAALATAAVAVGIGAAMSLGSTSAPEAKTAAADASSPNVFVIVVDTLRFDRTAAGGREGLTPVLDRLGREGAVFRRAYAQSSWTKPSVASIFTSLYPSTHQANLRRDRLSHEPPTMPEMFAQAGYRTAVFSANPWVSPAFGFERGVERFYESERETFVRLVILLRVLKATDRAWPGRPMAAGLGALEDVFGLRSERRTNCERDAAIADELRAWLAEEERPAFAYLHLMSPHIPYDPPRELDPSAGEGDDFSNAEQVALLQSPEPLPPGRAARLLELYDATIAHVDAVIGGIVAHLEETGAYDRSVIVVTADHGEEFHEHGRWGHGKSLYDELVRVPLVVRGPGVAPGQSVDEPAMLVDLLPTVAGLAGLPGNAGWEGSDLRTLVGARPAYAELIREGGFESYMAYRGLRKYIETTEGLGAAKQVEAYDLAGDPGETRNLAADGSRPDELAEVVARLREQAAERSVASTAVDIDEAAKERLEALGYLN